MIKKKEGKKREKAKLKHLASFFDIFNWLLKGKLIDNV